MLTLAFVCGPAKLFAEPDHWVTTWGCGSQLVEPRNLPPTNLVGSTLRQFVRVTIGGNRLRVRFSNVFGTEPVTMNAVHVAMAAGGVGTGNVNPATDRALAFRGALSVSIPPGGMVCSDPFDYNLPALSDLAISIYFGSISATTISGHPGSRMTSFIQAGNMVTAAGLPGATTTQHWYIINGVDVFAGGSSHAVVTLGDSITDGRGSTTDGNNRWPDDLARRLNARPSTADIAVDNMGIGGNGVFRGLGPSATARFDRDVIGQSGVRWVIVFEGVNDIGGDHTGTIATNLIAAYEQFVAKARAHNILAYGATITPFGGSFYFSPGHEASRQMVNAWIRTNQLYDGAIDFDAAVRDPAKRTKLFPAYNSGDGLHLNPAGYRAMADAIDLAWFTRRQEGRR